MSEAAPGRVSAVLLAAGESRRMGAENKLLLELDGEPIVRRTARALAAADLAEIVVVLGHESKRVRDALRDLPVTFVKNADYGEGQMTSVHRGLGAVADFGIGVMICLADQPFLTTEDYNALIAAFRERDGAAVLVPTYDGQRGNPIILGREQCGGIRLNSPGLGCKHLIARNPEIVTTVEFATDRVLRDIDTPGDYRDAGEHATA